MDNLLQKFRTPIIFFCIGVLCSSLFFWFRLESGSVADEDSIEIHSSSENAEGLENTVSADLSTRLYVGGAVAETKICELKAGQGLFDQVDSCVEFTDSADIESLKQSLGELDNSCEYESFLFVAAKSSSIQGVADASDVKVSTSGCVNINTATASELDSLPGIGPAYAAGIIDNRPYSSKLAIKKVKGIGDKTFAKLESLICL